MSTFVMHGHQYGWLASIWTGNPFIIAIAFLIGAFPDIGKFIRGEKVNRRDGLYEILHQPKWYFFYFFLHTVPDKYLFHDKANGGWRWFTFHVEVVYWLIFMLVEGETLLLKYLGFEMLPEYYVIGLFLASFAHDLEKLIVIEKYGWANIKEKFHHGEPHYWEIRTFIIWFVPLPILSIVFWSWIPLAGLLGFYIEDLLYYTYRLLVYKVPFPEVLRHLEELKIKSHSVIALPEFLRPLTLRKFVYVVAAQIISIAILWSLL